MFFNKEEIQSIAFEERQQEFKKPKTATCDDCKLCNDCRSPKMKPHGKGKKGIYLLGMCPGAQEDEENDQFVGESGQYLEQVLGSIGIDMNADCYKDNANRCRKFTTSKYGNEINVTPTNREINICRPLILKSIEELKPKKIITFGDNAVKSLVGHRTSNIGTIGKWVGWKIPDQDLKTWVYPNYHPAFLVRDEYNIPAQKLFKKYLEEAINHDKPFINHSNIHRYVQIETNLDAVMRILRSVLALKGTIAFDYETTGLKPHKNGHKILCMSISCGLYESYAFPFFENDRFLSAIKEILINPQIKKIIFNAKFENTWSYFKLGYDVVNFIADPMIAAHLLDNRSGITGLKFQTYVNYGILGYDKEVEKYIGGDKGGNSFNKLNKVPIEKLLLYCGMDSMFTYLLHEKQQKEISKWSDNRKNALNLFLKSTKTFCDIEKNGFNVNTNYYLKQNEHYKRRIERRLNQILNSKEVSIWKKKEGKKFNPRSPDHLKKLLFDYLNYSSTKLTESGEFSTDKGVLAELNTGFTNLILDYKKLYKIQNTYLEGFIREIHEDKIYPFNNLNITRTFRTSSSAPNYQNIPNREEEAKKIMRRGLIPRKGHQILGADYGQIEVRIGCGYHKDPKMIEYCSDPSTSMHIDMACDLFLLNVEEITSNIKYAAKNAFVFPEFYGSYYAQCTPNLWKYVLTEKLDNGISLRKHLIEKNIVTYEDFEKHVENIEFDFWHNRFKVYTRWKKKIWNFYEKNLYIESLDGFRYSGLMKKNDVLDYMIQGTACHCLLWSMNKIHRYLKNNNMETEILGQIHDELLFDICPDELNDLIPIIRKIMCEDIRKYFDWIIVPLEVEMKISAIDGNWYEMEKIES